MKKYFINRKVKKKNVTRSNIQNCFEIKIIKKIKYLKTSILSLSDVDELF